MSGAAGQGGYCAQCGSALTGPFCSHCGAPASPPAGTGVASPASAPATPPVRQGTPPQVGTPQWVQANAGAYARPGSQAAAATEAPPEWSSGQLWLGRLRRAFSVRVIFLAGVVGLVAGVLATLVSESLQMPVMFAAMGVMWLSAVFNDDVVLECPHCKKRVAISADTCSHCGRKVE